MVRVTYIGTSDGFSVSLRARRGALRTRKYDFHPYLDLPDGVASRILRDSRFSGMFRGGEVTAPLYCPKCDLGFKLPMALAAHNRAFHTEGVVRPYTKMLRCKQCGEEFEKAIALMNHAKRVHNAYKKEGKKDEKQVHAGVHSGGISLDVAGDGPGDSHPERNDGGLQEA